MRISEQMYNMSTETAPYDSANFEMLVLMLMLSVFSVVGSVGNGLVIFVFQRVRDKSTAQVFMTSMAVIDLFTCMVIIPLTMFVEYTGGEIKYDLLCKLYHFLITSKIPMSAFIMVAIAFDRYFCICCPLKHIITIRRARNIVICLALLASFLGLITSLFYGVYKIVAWIDVQKIDLTLGTNFTEHITNIQEIDMFDDYLDIERDNGERVISYWRAKLASCNKTKKMDLPITYHVMYMGICNPSSTIFSPTLFHIYQRTYMAVYPVCLLTVMVLYFMIYRFMCNRRSKKLKQKLIMCSYVNGDGTYEHTRLVSGEVEDGRRNSKSTTMALTDFPGNFPRSISGTNGFTPILNRHESENESRITEENLKNSSHENSLPRKKISSSPTIITNVVTPTENDDNTPILSFSCEYSCHNNSFRHSTTDRSQLVSVRRHSRIPEQKYHWHKNRDSMKRYKGKSSRRRSQYSCDADRLREENRSANVKTALMLFTVTLVFMVAFVPAWVMAHRLIPTSLPVFYLYFIYNVANPFIYAFMNHIFKDYMRKMFTCQDFTISGRRHS